MPDVSDAPDMYTTAGKLADLKQRYHEAVTASGEAAIAKQHAKGVRAVTDELVEFDEAARIEKFGDSLPRRHLAFGVLLGDGRFA